MLTSPSFIWFTISIYLRPNTIILVSVDFLLLLVFHPFSSLPFNFSLLHFDHPSKFDSSPFFTCNTSSLIGLKCTSWIWTSQHWWKVRTSTGGKWQWQWCVKMLSGFNKTQILADFMLLVSVICLGSVVVTLKLQSTITNKRHSMSLTKNAATNMYTPSKILL